MSKGGFMKDALILFAITLVAGACLGGVYEITKDPIAAANQAAKERAFREVLADADSFAMDDYSAALDITVTLEGETYTLTHALPESEDEDGKWYYQGEEFDGTDLENAVNSLRATDFTDRTASGREEIRLTAKLDREDIPSLSLTLTRYDGDHCLAALDGETVAYVKRSQAVDLIEAIHAVVLTG